MVTIMDLEIGDMVRIVESSSHDDFPESQEHLLGSVVQIAEFSRRELRYDPSSREFKTTEGDWFFEDEIQEVVTCYGIVAPSDLELDLFMEC